MYNVYECTLCPPSFLFFGTIADRTHIIIKTSGQTLHCPRPSESTNFSTIPECLCCGMEKVIVISA